MSLPDAMEVNHDNNKHQYLKKGNLVEEERNNEYHNFRGSDLLPRVIVGDTVYTRRRTKKSIERSDSSNSIPCQRMQ